MSPAPPEQAPGPTRPALTDGQLFIEGRWTEAVDGGRLDVIDPSTGQAVRTVADAGPSEAYQVGNGAHLGPRPHMTLAP